MTARGWLPNNNWLQSQLDANVNLDNTCNAFWNGSSINFYRSGGGCRNTGEIAAIYRLNASCVGYGFFETVDDGCGQAAWDLVKRDLTSAPSSARPRSPRSRERATPTPRSPTAATTGTTSSPKGAPRPATAG